MGSREFKLGKWVSNCHAKSILLKVPHCDLASSVSEIDLGSQPFPDFMALELVWDTEKNKFLVNLREFVRRQLGKWRVSLRDGLISWEWRRRSSLGLD